MSKEVPKIHYVDGDKKVAIVYASDILRCYFPDNLTNYTSEDNREFVHDWAGERGVIVGGYGGLPMTNTDYALMAISAGRDFVVVMDIE